MSPSSKHHEFPLFGERKNVKNAERQALFQKHHEFSLQIDDFLRNSDHVLGNSDHALGNSDHFRFRHCENITFLKVDFFDYENIRFPAGKVHVTKSDLFYNGLSVENRSHVYRFGGFPENARFKNVVFSRNHQNYRDQVKGFAECAKILYLKFRCSFDGVTSKGHQSASKSVCNLQVAV